MARQAGLHPGNQNVGRLGAGAGLRVAVFAFHGAVRTMRELAAFQPGSALGLALRETPCHEIHLAHHSVARGLVAVAALALEQVLLRIARHALQPGRRARPPERAPYPGDAVPGQDWRPAPHDRHPAMYSRMVLGSLVCGAGPAAGPSTWYTSNSSSRAWQLLQFCSKVTGSRAPGSGRTIGDVAIGALHGELHAANRSSAAAGMWTA